MSGGSAVNTVDVTRGLPVGTEIVQVKVFAQRYSGSQPVGAPRVFAEIDAGDARWWGVPRDGQVEPRLPGKRVPWNVEDFPEAALDEVSHLLLTLQVEPDHVDVVARTRAEGAFDFLLDGRKRLTPSRAIPTRAEGRLDFAESGLGIITIEHGQSVRSLRLAVSIRARAVPRPLTRPVPDDKRAAAATFIRQGWWEPYLQKASTGKAAVLAAAAFVAAHPDAGLDDNRSAAEGKMIADASGPDAARVGLSLRNALERLYRDTGDSWHSALRLLNLDTFAIDESHHAPGRVLHTITAERSEGLQLLARLIGVGVLREGKEFPSWADLVDRSDR